MKEPLRNFAMAVLWGTTAGGGPFLLLTVPVALVEMYRLPHWALYFATVPLLVAGLATMMAMLIIGVPLTLWLRHRGLEQCAIYTLLGANTGLVLPILLGWITDEPMGFYLSFPGLIAGTAAAYRWGRWREERNGSSEKTNDREPPLRPRSKPEKWSH